MIDADALKTIDDINVIKDNAVKYAMRDKLDSKDLVAGYFNRLPEEMIKLLFCDEFVEEIIRYKEMMERIKYASLCMDAEEREISPAVESILRMVSIYSHPRMTIEDMINRYMDMNDMNAAEVYTRSGISQSTISRIRHIETDYNQINKYLIIRLAFCLRMTFDEAKLLLLKAGYNFTELSPIDRALAFCMEHGYYNLNELDELVTIIEQETDKKPCGFIPKDRQ